MSAFRLTALFSLLLLPAASALSLTPVSRVSAPGAVAPAAVVALPGGARALCLGSRWLQVDTAGTVQRTAALPESCLSLSVSPSGKRLLSAGAVGFSVWNITDGTQVAVQTAAGLAGRAGFVLDDTVLLGTATGVDSLNLTTGTRQTVRQGSVSALFVAPDGKRAVISDGKKVQLVSLPDFTVLSATPCEGDCTVKNANFSADGRTAVALAGDTLIGLRENLPTYTVLRHVTAAVGLPQPDNTVLTVTDAGLESHDLQTGRREKVLRAGGLKPALAAQAGNRLLLLSERGELLDTDLTGGDIKRLTLPASLSGGGLSSGGAVYALSAGQLSLGGKPVPGTYWDVQTMNKFTWALKSSGDGGLSVGLLSGDKFAAIPGGPRTATRLSVNFWGNTAAVWNDDTLWVVSQAKNRVVSTVKLGGKATWITLSPDAARAYVYPGKGGESVADVMILATGKRTPVPEDYRPAGGFVNGMQFSGNGTGLFIGSRENLSVIDPKKRPALSGAREALGTLARFSPDSKWLAYISRDQSGSPLLTLLNLETGKVEATSPALADLPTFLAWSADSKKLAVGASLANELSSATVFELR